MHFDLLYLSTRSFYTSMYNMYDIFYLIIEYDKSILYEANDSKIRMEKANFGS